MTPEDLDSLSPKEIASRLFGAVSPDDWWSLEREGNKFRLRDQRLGLDLPVSAGFLVGLQEVSTISHALEFANRNRIRLVQDRGFLFKATSEIAIKCDGVPPIISPGKEPYRIQFSDGSAASVAHASFLFQRLVAIPSAEVNSALPDPSALTTLVMTNVDTDIVTDFAEVCLYELRTSFSQKKFEFVPLTASNVLGESLDDVVDEPGVIHSTFSTLHPWAIAFFNRATESEPLTGFLYYYRVLEACFDIIIADRINSWRLDEALDVTALLTRMRSIIKKEDTEALREVLGKIVHQSILDDALSTGVLDQASVDDLTSKIYLRRNEIAHGRRGQHQKVLVPYSFALNSSSERDIYWQQLMRGLAKSAIGRWLTCTPK